MVKRLQEVAVFCGNSRGSAIAVGMPEPDKSCGDASPSLSTWLRVEATNPRRFLPLARLLHGDIRLSGRLRAPFSPVIKTCNRRQMSGGATQETQYQSLFSCIGRIAQLVEQLTLNQRVQGSSPCAPTNAFNDLLRSWLFIPTWRSAGIPTNRPHLFLRCLNSNC